MKNAKSRFTSVNLRYLILVAVIMLLIIVFGLTADRFFTIGTLMNFFRQNAVLAIASMGMLLVMLTGGLDLSIGSTGAFACMAAALTMVAAGIENTASGWLGILLVVAVGLAVGSVNGFLIGYLRISPFMVTLGMQTICRGATIAISNNGRISIPNDVFTWLGSKDIRIPVGDTVARLPVSLLLVAAIIVITYLLLRRFTFGRKLYAVGGNYTAAICSGVHASRITFCAYLLCALYMSLSSIIWAGRTVSAVPLQGQAFEFEVLTAIILGGCSLSGGVGTLTGTLLGVALLGTINTGLSMMNVAPFMTYLIQGGLILVSVVLDTRMSVQLARTSGRTSAGADAADALSNRRQVMQNIEGGRQQELTLQNISKAFPGVKALEDVSITIRRGSVHAIMGENGAGKSTLMKILTGVYTKDAGEILIDGTPVEIRTPIDAQRLGISIIYQEFALIPYLSLDQNIFLGKEINSRIRLFIDNKKMRREAEGLLERVNLRIPVNASAEECKVGHQQMVEIAKAVGANAWIVVMDEPTAAITENEKNKLFEIIRELKAQGVAVVYITHRMAEVFEIADELTVLRDGKHVVTAPVSQMDDRRLINYMVGRDLMDIFSRERAVIQDIVFEVKNLSRKGAFEPISFEVRAGEVLGFSGLIGAGRTEIARCIFGLDKFTSGEIYVDGKRVGISSPTDAIAAGICLVSEDRRREGIIPLMDIEENIAIPSLRRLSRLGWIDDKRVNEIAFKYTEKLQVKTPSLRQKIGNLSGGNQQKVCLAKWLALSPRVIILDEPTRGIDVGAKAEIHKLIEGLAKQGMAIIIISSEMPELLGVSDRVVVLHEGKMTGEFKVDEDLTQEKLLESAMGIA